MHRIQVGHLAQLLGELQFKHPIFGHQLISAHQHVFIVIGGHDHARSHGQAQGRDAQYIADEGVGFPVPGVEERTGADQALGLNSEVLRENRHVPALQVQVIVADSIGPKNPHHIGPFGGTDAQHLRVALPVHPSIPFPSAQLDYRTDGLAVVLLTDPTQANAVPAAVVGAPDADPLIVEGHELNGQVPVQGEVEVAGHGETRAGGLSQGKLRTPVMSHRKNAPGFPCAPHQIAIAIEVHITLARVGRGGNGGQVA